MRSRSFSLYIVLADRVAKRSRVSGLDGLGAAMLIAAVVVTPIGGWRAVPTLVIPIVLVIAGVALHRPQDTSSA